jgi:acetyl esterase/lipase
MQFRSRAAFLATSMLAASNLAFVCEAQDKDDVGSRYAPTPAVLYPGGVQSLRDVTFAQLSGFRPLTLDLYLPPAGRVPHGDGASHPAVVFIHGGAFRHRTARDGGTFRDFPAVLAAVAARGYVVASVNYRLVGEVRFPGPVQDVEMAIRWLRLHATDYGVDPTRFVAWGSSAGGQIATLIGTACGIEALQPPALPNIKGPLPSVCVQGVIDWYGLIDLQSNPTDLGKSAVPGIHGIEDAYLGCEVSRCPPGLAHSASPLAYIDSNDPRFLIQHGAADVTVSAKQSQKLYAALRAAGVPVELVVYPNVAHGFAKVPEGGPDEAVNQQALDKVFEFLRHYFPAREEP